LSIAHLLANHLKQHDYPADFINPEKSGDFTSVWMLALSNCIARERSTPSCAPTRFDQVPINCPTTGTLLPPKHGIVFVSG